MAVGNPKHLASTEAALSEKYKIKTEMLGGEQGDVKEVKILTKIVRLTSAGVELEADPRHAELVVRELGVGNCRTTKVLGSKATGERSEARMIKPSKKMEISAMDGESSEGEMAQVENEGEDDWINEGEDGIWRRKHKIGRRGRFTLCGTKGSPKRPSGLGSKRITEGTYIVSDESFIKVDDWKDKRDDHRRGRGVDWNVDFRSGLDVRVHQEPPPRC